MATKKRKKKHEVCMTAGELIVWLTQHPKATPIKIGFGQGCVPVLFNRNGPDEHIGIEENDGSWDD